MGRPLKIKQSTTVDIGFNDFGNVEVPVIPAGMTTAQFLGVVGGLNTNIATAAYPVVKITANVNGQEGTAHIITQKGTTKYLVSGSNSVNAGSFTPGFSYQIISLGNTDWTAIGAPATPTVGTVFTATGAGSGSGTASDAGQCVLVANSTINSGQMNMIFSANGGSVYASRLTNKYIYDAAGGRFAVNFFVAGDTTATTINNVAVANTAGWFTANATTFTTGQVVSVSGTLTGNATITGYTNPTTYYVINTNGTTTFQLAATYNGSNIATAAGNTRGLTFSDAISTTAKSGADGVTFSNGTGDLTVAEVDNYTS
jgi:hypothetical protein